MLNTKILIAEDDRAVRDALRRALRLEGYEVTLAADGSEALTALDRARADLIILDVLMPYVNGLSVCRTLRSRGDRTPVLMLTARHEVGDRVAGLDAGADDYLTKPFALDELLARIRALLRRSDDSALAEVLRYQDLELDMRSRRARRGERLIDLTKTEFDLLELLMANAGVVLDRDLIYQRIWDIGFETTSNSLDVYIGYLRRKVEGEGESRLIHTVRGVGYVLRDR